MKKRSYERMKLIPEEYVTSNKGPLQNSTECWNVGVGVMRKIGEIAMSAVAVLFGDWEEMCKTNSSQREKRCNKTEKDI